MASSFHKILRVMLRLFLYAVLIYILEECFLLYQYNVLVKLTICGDFIIYVIIYKNYRKFTEVHPGPLIGKKTIEKIKLEPNNRRAVLR